MSRAEHCRPGRGRCRGRREMADGGTVIVPEAEAPFAARNDPPGDDWWLVDCGYLVAIVSHCPWCGRPLGKVSP